MIGITNLFLPLLIQILVLYFLSRLVDKLVLRRLGRGWYLATMWPGVMIHELSHFVGCLITLTKVYRVHLFDPSGDSLGFVEHARTRNPLKNIIISIAPLFGVTAVIWLLTKFLFPELYLAFSSNISAALSDFTTFQNFFNITRDYFLQYWIYIKDLAGSFDLGAWQTYVFIYLMLSLSSHAAPSKEDLKHTYAGLAGLIVIFTLIYYVDQWLQVPITWTIIKWLTTPVYLAAGFLTYGIIFAAISLVIMLIFSLIVRLFKRESGSM
jgi:hypothetical protein